MMTKQEIEHVAAIGAKAISDLSQFTIHELQALVEQGMPPEWMDAELKRRELERLEGRE